MKENSIIYKAIDPMKITVSEGFNQRVDFGDIDELLIPEIRMLGYQFDFERIKNRIIKMTDTPDKVYATAPLKKI